MALTILESQDVAVTNAVRERLERLQRQADLAQRLDEISKRYASLPVLDNRTADEILGSDENGLPT